MGNFGVELIVVNDRSIMNRTSPEIVTSRILQAVDSTPPSYLYFHPREYRVSSVNPIDGSPLLPLVNVVGMGNVRALIFPERHTLWFARGAVLSLAPGVVLIIRGSIIADPTQIFDLPEVRARLINPTSTVPAGTALVRFESTRIEEIYHYCPSFTSAPL